MSNCVFRNTMEHFAGCDMTCGNALAALGPKDQPLMEPIITPFVKYFWMKG